MSNTHTVRNSPAFEALDTLLQRRVLVLDGAMGTMIQRHKLTEADFRGDRGGRWTERGGHETACRRALVTRYCETGTVALLGVRAVG